MDKVYILTIEDIDDGVSLINKIEVYADYNKAKQVFDAEVKTYLEKNDFTEYVINKEENDFSVYIEHEYLLNHVEIHITEQQIIK